MNCIRSIFLILLCLITTIHASAQQRINGFALPESVTSSNGRFFVSNVGVKLEPMAKDGDGYISELDAKGNVVSQKFLPQKGATLNAPKGMAVAGNVLYIADIDRLVGFDISTGRQVFLLDLTGVAALLNGVCKVDDRTLLVADTFKDVVFQVDVAKKSYAVAGSLPAPNGLNYNPSTGVVYVCTIGKNMDGKGRIYERKLKDVHAPFKELPNSPEGTFDGVQLLDESHLLCSDWVSFKSHFGKLWIADLHNNKWEEVLTEPSPADIYYDKASQNVYIPQMLNNRVLISDLAELRKLGKDIAGTGKAHDCLYQYGIASALLGGLYKGDIDAGSLKAYGDFGLGAPDMLDGEIIINNGKIYQAHATGKNHVADDSLKLPFAMSCFFIPERTYNAPANLTDATTAKWLDSLLVNKNGIYAIRIRGSFSYVKTRAFPPVTKSIDTPLPQMMDKQKVFEYRQLKGTMVGFRVPAYLGESTITGYHFHFVSDDETIGGHALDFTADNVKVEVDELSDFSIRLPQLPEFKTFDFNKGKTK